MKDEASIDKYADELYLILKDQRRITPILVQRHAHVDFDMAMKICERIWRRLREDAQKWALEVIEG